MNNGQKMISQNHFNDNIYFRLSKRISYRKLLKIIISRWYWLVIALGIGLVASFIYLGYAQPMYLTSASLKFEEKRSEISELLSVRNLYDKTNKVESEKLIISSRYVLLKAISSLNYQVSYYTKAPLKLIDIYPITPINVKILKKDNRNITNNDFKFKAINLSQYQLCYTLNNNYICKTYQYGQIINLPQLQFEITKPKTRHIDQNTYVFKFNSDIDLLRRVSKSLKINETQNVNLLNLSITDYNPYFATNILNAILHQYLKFDRSLRAASVSQTTQFIDTLLKTMSTDVENYGKLIQQFKENNKIFSISSSVNYNIERLAKLEAEKYNSDTKTSLMAILEKNISESRENNKLDYNLQGIADPSLGNLLLKYNELIAKKKALSYAYTQNAAILIQLEEQLLDFKAAIFNNIGNQKKGNDKTHALLDRQIDSNRQVMINIPKMERLLISLQSKFDINQKVYAYLAEKQLEAQISKASITASAIVIDKAEYPEKPVSPIPQNIYASFILLSLISGIAFVFFIRLLNPYLYNRESIEQLTNVPVIGVIRKYTNRAIGVAQQISFLEDPRSLFSESIRYVRSNLSFLATKKGSKTICITSEISGEGKSFVSLNLAGALTLTNKNVLLIAADLRKSKLHTTFNISNKNGLSQYLSGQTSADQIIKKTYLENLDFISSGPVPPNSSELLHGEKMKQLLTLLKKRYDFILIDTAPIGLVTDGKPLIKMADISLFILRAGVSRYHFAITPEKLKKEFNLTRIAIILNDYENYNFHSDYYTAIQSNSHYHPGYYPAQVNAANQKSYLDL